MKFRKPVILFLIFLNVYLNIYAQNESLHFEHIGAEDGISNENVKAIIQDKKGYIWFATMSGLNKYDGYSFTKYLFDPLDSNSLSQNNIYTIWEDQYGSIWVGNPEGLCKFDRTTEKFTRYKPNPDAKFFDPNISSINEDRDGMMWVGSYASGLCRFDRQKGTFLPEIFDLNGNIFCIYKDRVGTLWVGSSTGLHKMNMNEKKTGKHSNVSFTHYQHNPKDVNSLSSNKVTTVFEDQQGIIWLATDNGLNSFDRKNGVFKRYQHNPKNIHSISSNNAAVYQQQAIKEDRDGNLWIGTAKGLNKLNKDRTQFTAYHHDDKNVTSLSTDIVISLHIDKANILYAGSWGGKLNKANLNPKTFGIKHRDQNIANALSNNAVTSIVEDSTGIIWIGTYGGGLNRWDKKNDVFTHFKHDPFNIRSLRSDSILALLDDQHGHLWVCNRDVISQLNKKTGEFIHYNTNVRNYKDNRSRFITSITEDLDGFIWLGTGNGLKRFNEKNGELKHLYYDPADTNGISDFTAITVFADSRNNIWIGYGSRATDRFQKQTGRFIHYKHDPKDPRSISSNVVKSFHEDSKGNLWMGTLSGGLCLFDYQTEHFITFTDKHGLPDNTVYSILSDNKNLLWLGTDKGLSHFDPVAGTFINYDYRDGLQSNKFAAGGGGDQDRGAHFKGKDGTLYFGGTNGFNYFNPLQVIVNSYIAPIVITQFKIYDKHVKGANELEKILLNHDQNYFSFEFSSLSYYIPSKNQYAYKLEGVDKDWIYSGSRRYAAYTNIDPGTYTFKVKGTNNDGIWNEKGESIIIIINPPWWNTWLFKVAASICLIASFYGFIRWRMHEKFSRRLLQIEKEKQVAELQQQKTELEMQALRAQMNPHFIFNSLNSINRFILQNDRVQASEYLTKFSKLIRLILQNSQASLITLESELETLQLYLELESLRFDHHFTFEIIVKENLETDIYKVPPLIIQPFTENAIWHGLMNKKEGGHLEIELFEEDNMLYCKITDDGIGRKKSAELKSKTATTYKSMGMQITANRINMLHQTKQMNSTIKITDLILADGNAGGTEVLLKIPLIE